MHAGFDVEEIVSGKPVSIGGIAGRREATGHGVVYLIERALNVLGMQAEGRTAIVQGFGNVGAITALSLAYKSGMKVVGIADESAALYNADGIDVGAAEKYDHEHHELR